MTAKELGQVIHLLLREKKQIPNPTPKLVSPKVQGWLAGIVASCCQNLDNENAHAFTVQFYTTALAGVPLNQQMALDMILTGKRILEDGPTIGYNAIFHEYLEIGRAEPLTKETASDCLLQKLL